MKGRLHILEDNEAVIKMIIKGRSLLLRHVSGAHRVALDWLFDRINLDPKIQIKYVDTKNQLAFMLTNGSFTRDEWCNLLRLFNIMNFSTFSRSHFRSIERQTPCCREFKKGRRTEELAVAKPRSTCLISRIVLNQKQPSSSGSDASDVLVNPQLDSESVLGSTSKPQQRFLKI